MNYNMFLFSRAKSFLADVVFFVGVLIGTSSSKQAPEVVGRMVYFDRVQMSPISLKLEGKT
tara:strand:+ start:2106 stop:2288 length:183 start_codon:yes stop_codon:yes gene_type:complete